MYIVRKKIAKYKLFTDLDRGGFRITMIVKQYS